MHDARRRTSGQDDARPAAGGPHALIPVFRPTLDESEIEAVAEVLRSGWWGLGPKTREFELAFAEYLGAKHAVGLNSCTAALHLGMNVLNVEGGEVITTPMTFVSTNHAILWNKAEPVFADIQPDTLNIDPDDVERLISPRTKAIVVVHYGGHPVDLDRIGDLARAHNIPVIEDAAHACGSEYKGKKIGTLSEVTCFSFHAVKNLAMGEGGAITTDNPEIDRKLRELRWLGITKDTWSRAEDFAKYSWAYGVESIGFKYHLSDIAAAIGLVQLKKLERTNARRRQIAERYNAAFEGVAGIRTPFEQPGTKSAWHNYVIQLQGRDDLMKELQDAGIATGMHYIPNHLFPVYKPWYRELPVTETVWRNLVTLPLFPDLTDEQVDRIIEAVIDFVE